MRFYSTPLPVPTMLRTAEFLLRPLTPTHVQLDYDALMVSKEMLRLWSGSSWPSDDFSLADNHKDLVWHDDEHQKRIAFTYTVLTPDETTCLGCIYIKPLANIEAYNPGLFPDISSTDALVRFWIRQDYLKSNLDDRLLQAMLNWFQTDWHFARTLFHTRTHNLQQTALLNTLPMIGEIKISDRGGAHYLFGNI